MKIVKLLPFIPLNIVLLIVCTRQLPFLFLVSSFVLTLVVVVSIYSMYSQEQKLVGENEQMRNTAMQCLDWAENKWSERSDEWFVPVLLVFYLLLILPVSGLELVIGVNSICAVVLFRKLITRFIGIRD